MKAKNAPTSPLSLSELLSRGYITPEQHALLSSTEVSAGSRPPSSPPPSTSPTFYTHTVSVKRNIGLDPVPSDPFISGVLTRHPSSPSTLVYFAPIYINTDSRTWKSSPARDKLGNPISNADGPIINTLVGESRLNHTLLTLTLPHPVTGRPRTIHLSAFARLSASPLSFDDAEEKLTLDKTPAPPVVKDEEALTLDELEARERSSPPPRLVSGLDDSECSTDAPFSALTETQRTFHAQKSQWRGSDSNSGPLRGGLD